ncbi:unnamed protein product [Alopecurus aequalis]
MTSADCLSDLCDDLLVSVISFLPAREAARTAALSRRWRLLWLLTNTHNLDSRSYCDTENLDLDDSWLRGDLDPFCLRDKLFSDASDALDATGWCPVKKLALFIKGYDADYCRDVMGTPRWEPPSRDDTYDLMASLIAAPALRHVEELRVQFKLEKQEDLYCVYHLDPALLPGDTLRVLDLTCCALKSAPGSAAAFFPRLSVLRLRSCSSSTKHFEDLIRAMPNLRSLHIEGHRFNSYLDRLVVLSPTLTTLTLVDGFGDRQGIELDTLCLRAFNYNRPLTEFSMKSQAAKLGHVDLTLEWMYEEDGRRVELRRSAPFWEFLRNFRHVKSIRLKVQNLECIAVDRKEDVQHEHPVTLPGLEQLDLDIPYEPYRRDVAATAVASFLRCCPIIHDLRIRIATDNWDYHRCLSEFVMNLFQRRYSEDMVPPMLHRDHGCSQTVDLLGLAGCRFSCVQNSLKNIKLQFEFVDLDSFI